MKPMRKELVDIIATVALGLAAGAVITVMVLLSLR